MVNRLAMQKVMTEIEEAPFTETSKKGQYTGDLAHEWIMSKRLGLDLWLEARKMIVLHGTDRMFFRTRFRYLDWNGYTYWVMPQWVKPNWRDIFDPTDNYVLNRQKIRSERERA